MLCVIFGTDLTKPIDMANVKQGLTNIDDWKNYPDELPADEPSTPSGKFTGIFIDVNTSAAKFKNTPHYLVSLLGTSSMWDVTGINAVYKSTPEGFRVYLRWAGRNGLRKDDAKANNWVIQWTGLEDRGQ